MTSRKEGSDHGCCCVAVCWNDSGVLRRLVLWRRQPEERVLRTEVQMTDGEKDVLTAEGYGAWIRVKWHRLGGVYR